jgi:hypothetical protein
VAHEPEELEGATRSEIPGIELTVFQSVGEQLALQIAAATSSWSSLRRVWVV